MDQLRTDLPVTPTPLLEPLPTLPDFRLPRRHPLGFMMGVVTGATIIFLSVVGSHLTRKQPELLPAPVPPGPDKVLIALLDNEHQADEHFVPMVVLQGDFAHFHDVPADVMRRVVPEQLRIVPRELEEAPELIGPPQEDDELR